jgi:hypothetical protein
MPDRLTPGWYRADGRGTACNCTTAARSGTHRYGGRRDAAADNAQAEIIDAAAAQLPPEQLPLYETPEE